MARTKQSKGPGSGDRRTTWTRFHLPRGQDWPTWSTSHSDPHRGPLTDVAGIKNVWLGRRVEDSEQAALIILWKTEDALKEFQDSPTCDEFLQYLPENGAQASPESGALLRDLSLSNADGGSLSPAPSRFLSFQWIGIGFEEKLQGRVTFTALVIPYTSDTIPESSRIATHRAVRDALDKFRPRGCEDISSPYMQTHFWKQLAMVNNKDALVDSDPWQLGEQVATAGNEGGRMVYCEFRQWNGYSGATPEREEATANSQLTRESWAQMFAKVMPSVTAWTQERWDIQLVPQKEEEEGEYEEDSEYDRNMEEYLNQNLPYRHDKLLG
ncbi:hypothetical protein V502_00714 [Pseudogymnoascus sp. VKM F-4520 (FW-2644)]|nr:hypothetical protein V502_00714 [Pseudogymnoascus sp. VKM F-4520 (FW-2644)]